MQKLIQKVEIYLLTKYVQYKINHLRRLGMKRVTSMNIRIAGVEISLGDRAPADALGITSMKLGELSIGGTTSHELNREEMSDIPDLIRNCTDAVLDVTTKVINYIGSLETASASLETKKDEHVKSESHGAEAQPAQS